jgi:hypothetical protein
MRARDICKRKINESGMFSQYGLGDIWIREVKFTPGGGPFGINGVRIILKLVTGRADISVCASDCTDEEGQSKKKHIDGGLHSNYSDLCLALMSMSHEEFAQKDIREIIQELFKKVYDGLMPFMGKLANVCFTGDL